MNAQSRVKSAMTELVMSEPFWAVLALKLAVKSDPSCKTGWTDGKTLAYNPVFIDTLTDRQVRGFIAHETAHCAFGHPWRRGTRDHKRFNAACDYAINGILLQAGFTLPAGVLIDSKYDGLSAEAIYSALQSQEPKDSDSQDSQPGNGSPDDTQDGTDPNGSQLGDDPGACGETRDCDESGPDTDTQAEWAQAVLEAERMGKSNMPTGMSRAVTEATNPPCRDLVAAVMEWAQAMSANDYSWRAPSRRFMASGLYLPTLRPSLGRIASAVDTSGSIRADHLSSFISTLQRVLDECNPEAMTVLACDDTLRSTREFMPGDSLPSDGYDGGYGTDFKPVFDTLANDPPAGCIYLTDLDGSFPDVAPEYPVLWVVRDDYGRRCKAPFGEVIYLA